MNQSSSHLLNQTQIVSVEAQEGRLWVRGDAALRPPSEGSALWSQTCWTPPTHTLNMYEEDPVSSKAKAGPARLGMR